MNPGELFEQLSMGSMDSAAPIPPTPAGPHGGYAHAKPLPKLSGTASFFRQYLIGGLTITTVKKKTKLMARGLNTITSEEDK